MIARMYAGILHIERHSIHMRGWPSDHAQDPKLFEIAIVQSHVNLDFINLREPRLPV